MLVFLTEILGALEQVALSDPGSTMAMAWVLQELRLHQQAEREGVPRELLG